MKDTVNISTMILILSMSGCNQSADTTHSPQSIIRSIDGEQVELDISTTRLSENKKFRVTVLSELNPAEINTMHSWLIKIESVDGKPIINACITIDGGMPEHNHGLPTSPRVTSNLGKGEYLLEGVRYNMGGWWEFKINIAASDQMDTVVFNRVIPE